MAMVGHELSTQKAQGEDCSVTQGREDSAVELATNKEWSMKVICVLFPYPHSSGAFWEDLTQILEN